MAKEKKEKPDKKAKTEKKEKKTKKEQKAKAESTSKKKSNANLEKIRSTQIFSPIQDVRDGIIITKDKHFVKVMEFSPINFGLRSASEQAVIIDQFAAVLRVMPIRAHFKIICRESNVQKFVEKIKEEMDQETNPNCLALQKEQMNLISSVSQVQGVSRRFLIAFEYEDENFFSKSPSFEDVKINLNRIAWSIKNSMSRCGNDLISIDDNDSYTLALLYSIMSRAYSMTMTYEEREFETIAKYAGAIDVEEMMIPVNDFISPMYIDTRISPKYILVDGLYYMFLYIDADSYPERAYGGWMQILMNLGRGIDVDFWYKKESIESIQRKLRYRIRWNKIKMRDTEDTAQDYDDLMSSLRSGYYMKESLSGGDEFCYFSTVLTLTATNIPELNQKFDYVKKTCLQSDLKVHNCLFKQEEMFRSTLPLARPESSIFEKSKRNVMLSALASAYPFTSFELTDENGILLGNNMNNGSLVFVDIFDTAKYANANVAILGSSGSGKTYTLQCMALRMREKQTQVFIIAPDKGFEFERACNAVGGQFIRITPGSGQNINIMEIRKKDETANVLIDGANIADESILSKKIAQLHTFFSLLIPDITYKEKYVLDEQLIKTYKKFGITEKNKSLLDPSNPERYKKMPVLGDLYKELELAGEDAERLRGVLTRYVTGSASAFNQQTNVDLNNKYIVLDVSNLTKEMLPIGMFIALDYVWDKAREDRTQKKIIFLDETWRLVGTGASTQSAEFVLEIFKVIRGYGGSAVAATQDLNDFFAMEDGKYGAGIINNAKIKMLMKTEPREAQVVADAMDLTASELEEIKRIEKGTCLLAAASNHVFINIQASRTEHDLITTDRKDLGRIARERAKMQEMQELYSIEEDNGEIF